MFLNILCVLEARRHTSTAQLILHGIDLVDLYPFDYVKLEHHTHHTMTYNTIRLQLLVLFSP